MKMHVPDKARPQDRRLVISAFRASNQGSIKTSKLYEAFDRYGVTSIASQVGVARGPQPRSGAESKHTTVRCVDLASILGLEPHIMSNVKQKL